MNTAATSTSEDAALSAAPQTESAVEIGRFLASWSPQRPLRLHSEGTPLTGGPGASLVEIFTAQEQRSRTSQAYYRSGVGGRLRVTDLEQVERNDAVTIHVTQRDEVTSLEVCTTLTAPRGTSTVRVQSVLRNRGPAPLTLTTVSTATVGFGRDEDDLAGMTLMSARTEWLAENRWHARPLRDVLPQLNLALHGQDGRGRAAITSHGAWPSGEHLPTALITAPEGAIAWQLETSGPWHVDLSQTAQGGVLGLHGPTDLEHQFARTLQPGQSFRTVAVALCAVEGGDAASSHSVGNPVVDDIAAQLTSYRRWLLRHRRDEPMPLVYNDFMNTLMGQPSTQALIPLVKEAGALGLDVFCIDAGWFASPAIGDWWATIGEWNEAKDRFDDGGLARICETILDQGMRVGLWLEPEIVGADSPAVDQLPEDAFFRRHGQKVREHDRYHLDMRHPAAREHLDEVVDRIVEQYAVSYLKLDYNINPGAGTEVDASSPADGLLAHTRAFRDWVIDIQARHPGLQVENCASGAMRADYSLLSVTHLQSTSDQQDLRLYPPVAASAPFSILPEQCGNWAYPAADMSEEETTFTLVSGLAGRFYLSGFLDRLRPDQMRAVADAVSLHRQQVERLRYAVPFWPLGLPAWDDELICSGLRDGDDVLLFVWDRAERASEFVIPGDFADASQEFTRAGWQLRPTPRGLEITTLPGVTARVIRARRGGQGEVGH